MKSEQPGAGAGTGSGTMVVVEIGGPVARRDAIEVAAYALGVQGLEVVDEDVGAPRGRVIVRLWVPSGDAPRAQRALRRALGDEVQISIGAPVRAASARAVPVGRTFVVVPPGEPVSPRWRRRTALQLAATEAFGDGAHPTTALCVGALERMPAEALRGARVLDVGTGTGVLALVAVLRGAAAAVATDVDPLARRAARAAVRRHELAARISVRATLPRDRFDLVIANLYRDVLIAEGGRIAARVAPGGGLLVSGFAASSIPEITATFAAHGLAPASRARNAGWGALRLTRPEP